MHIEYLVEYLTTPRLRQILHSVRKYPGRTASNPEIRRRAERKALPRHHIGRPQALHHGTPPHRKPALTIQNQTASSPLHCATPSVKVPGSKSHILTHRQTSTSSFAYHS
ncbi:hypothetical protein K458DRAFT_160299 [Lentithecium fluviatile CBS 122367]|uniref:Uncharacterized protein n=1 Tax=Lentithecium fluviatile CBS 122367 TaxID=1168545 RepID=A0A6G1IH06_9PLEO|nr:hypothetical protein K458DRAFT_160299 [Lentithecium fluviatile CBS 122367]